MCACGDRDGVASGITGIAHVSCLAEQAKILCDEAEENNLDKKVQFERFGRWHKCSLCKQQYHGVVRCALGWACWKTYVGRPEVDQFRGMAMGVLGNGLHDAKHYEDALSVQEVELSMRRRLGIPEKSRLAVQTNLAASYQSVGRLEEANRMLRDVYFGRLKLFGEEHANTTRAAYNYATSLLHLKHVQEAKSLMRRTLPVAQRVLGESSELALMMRSNYGMALHADDGATLDDLREAVTSLEDAGRIARRVFGGAHPLTTGVEDELQDARAKLRARETPPRSA